MTTNVGGRKSRNGLDVESWRRRYKTRGAHPLFERVEKIGPGAGVDSAATEKLSRDVASRGRAETASILFGTRGIHMGDLQVLIWDPASG